MLNDQDLDSWRHRGKNICLRFNSGSTGSARNSKASNTRFFHQPDQVDIIDMPVGIHVAPAHGHLHTKH
ncbi:hypothetical protein D3C74_473650 [compost metagenome]